METFVYRARNSITGKKIRGEVQAENERNAKELLRRKKLEKIILSKRTILNTELGAVFYRMIPLKLQDITFFCRQFASMLQAGVSIGKSLSICAEQCSNHQLKAHIMHIYQAVSEGTLLSVAIKQEKVFPNILENLIACGETTGNLDQVLNKAVIHFDTQLGIQKKIKKAMTYPTMVLIVAIVVVVILMLKVIPGYIDLITQTGAELPKATHLVIAMSDFMIKRGNVLLVGSISLMILVIYLKKVACCKRLVDKMILKLPIVGTVQKKNISATFASTLAMLIQSGVPMLQAIEITRSMMTNRVASEELKGVGSALKQGSSLYDALNGSAIYPRLMLSMIRMGEETGRLDDMLETMSHYFKQEVESAVDRMTLLIEPLMTIILALIVGFLLLAIMSPTFAAASAVM